MERIYDEHQDAIDAFAHDRGQLAYDKAIAGGFTLGEAETSGQAAREEGRLFLTRTIAAAEANPEDPQV
jgi:hypothetical protein